MKQTLFLLIGIAFAAAAETGPVPEVVVVHPSSGAVTQRLTLPGSLEPYERTTLFANVTGYLKTIAVDIGDTVTTGTVSRVFISWPRDVSSGRRRPSFSMTGFRW